MQRKQRNATIRLVLCSAVVALLACLSSGAIAGVEDPRDTAAVRAVKLDMDKVRRFAATAHAMDQLPDSPQPAIREAGGNGHGVERAAPVAEVAAELNAHPKARAILAAHQFSADDFYKTALALANCMFATAFVQPGKAPSVEDLEKASVTVANARFCQANLEEIGRALQ